MMVMVRDTGNSPADAPWISLGPDDFTGYLSDLSSDDDSEEGTKRGWWLGGGCPPAKRLQTGGAVSAYRGKESPRERPGKGARCD